MSNQFSKNELSELTGINYNRIVRLLSKSPTATRGRYLVSQLVDAIVKDEQFKLQTKTDKLKIKHANDLAKLKRTLTERHEKKIGDEDVDVLNEEQIRLTAARADKVELEKRLLEGAVEHVDIMVDYWGGMVSSCRSRLLSLPSRSATILKDMDSHIDIQTYLEEQIHESLEELSQDGIPESTRYRSQQATNYLEATAETEGE